MINRLIILSLCAVLLTSCTQPDRTVNLLKQQGYTEIKTQPYNIGTFFACSEDDQFRTPFTAKSPNGSLVSGVVCSGILKGATIRFN